jgi:chromosome partitioning protein
MMRILAIANQKGGVGKTTTVVNLAAALAERERRVLACDLDPQGSLTLALGLTPDALEKSMWDALTQAVNARGTNPLQGIIIRAEAGFDLAPANISLSQADVDLIREPLGVFALRDALAPIRANYDYILLDCPPSLGILTNNALAAANEVIIPLQSDYLALKGVDLLLRAIEKMKRANPTIRVAGILFTMADTRALHTHEIIAAAKEAFPQLPFFTEMVRLSVRAKEAPVAGQSILQYARTHPVANAYRSLAAEVEEGIKPPTNLDTDQHR